MSQSPSVRRIRYVGLSPEIGPPLWPSAAAVPSGLSAQVGRNIRALNAVQQDILERRFWRGQTLTQIGRSLDLSAAQVRRELRRALATLRCRLADTPGDVMRPTCKLCRHPQRDAINRRLAARRPADTWRGYLRMLRFEFGVTGLPAKAIQSHIESHTIPEGKKHDLT